MTTDQLIESACEAQETIGVDELERFANLRRSGLIIRVSLRECYGRTVCDALDDKHKVPIQLLTGAKTLTAVHVRALAALGFSFGVVTLALGGKAGHCEPIDDVDLASHIG